MAEDQAARDRIAFLRGLRAVRQFRQQPVPDEIVDDIINVARWSGSASNTQPWELIVIRNPETLRALANIKSPVGSAGHLAGAALGIVLVMDGKHYDNDTYDEGRLSERIMLAAAAHGVGSCIGWFSGEGATAAKALLGVPEERLVRTALSVGYPDEDAQRARPKRDQPRKPLAEIMHQERYG
jgi:nitroreductase